MKTIFLDFDGVLHGEGINSGAFFEHADAFCNFLRPYKDRVQVVISSSWREEKTLEELKQFFHSDLHDVFVGVTPVIPERYAPGGRQVEIKMYCDSHNILEWVALDDMERFFYPDCKNLILIDGQTGLSLCDYQMVEWFLNN